jgi:hypothetical protein
MKSKLLTSRMLVNRNGLFVIETRSPGLVSTAIAHGVSIELQHKMRDGAWDTVAVFANGRDARHARQQSKWRCRLIASNEHGRCVIPAAWRGYVGDAVGFFIEDAVA